MNAISTGTTGFSPSFKANAAWRPRPEVYPCQKTQHAETSRGKRIKPKRNFLFKIKNPRDASGNLLQASRKGGDRRGHGFRLFRHQCVFIRKEQSNSTSGGRLATTTAWESHSCPKAAGCRIR